MFSEHIRSPKPLKKRWNMYRGLFQLGQSSDVRCLRSVGVSAPAQAPTPMTAAQTKGGPGPSACLLPLDLTGCYLHFYGQTSYLQSTWWLIYRGPAVYRCGTGWVQGAPSTTWTGRTCPQASTPAQDPPCAQAMLKIVSLAIGKMQSKCTRDHLPLSGPPESQRWIIISVDKDKGVENSKASYAAGGKVKGCSCLGNSLAVPQLNAVTIRPSHSTPRHRPSRYGNTRPHKSLDINVHSSMIRNSQKVGTTHMLVDW